MEAEKDEACPKAGPPDESSSANTVRPVDSSANKVGWRKFGTDTPGSRATRGQSVLRMPTYKISLLPPPVSTQGCFFLESKSGRAGKFPGYLENRFANISKKTIKQRKFKKTLPCGPVFVPKVRAGGRDGMLLRQRSGCFRQSGEWVGWCRIFFHRSLLPGVEDMAQTVCEGRQLPTGADKWERKRKLYLF